MKQTLLVVSIFSLFFSSCATDLEKIKKITEEEKTYSEQGYDVELYYSELGELKAKIIAPLLTRYNAKKPYTEFTDGLKTFFYSPAGEIESKLSANYGIIYKDNEELLVRDDVILINIEGEKLNAEELTWKKSEGKIYSDKFVKITTHDEIIYGTGFEATQDFSEYTIKNISGIINVEDEELQ